MRHAKFVVAVLCILTMLNLVRVLNKSQSQKSTQKKTRDSGGLSLAPSHDAGNPAETGFYMKEVEHGQIATFPVGAREFAPTRVHSEDEKAQMMKVFQEWCLPKLICELRTSQGAMDSLTPYELRLIQQAQRVSINSKGELASRFRFASHMGQFLYGVEGNGCYNFFSQCPFTRTTILRLGHRFKSRQM